MRNSQPPTENRNKIIVMMDDEDDGRQRMVHVQNRERWKKNKVGLECAQKKEETEKKKKVNNLISQFK